MIEIQGLTKKYHDFYALNELTLTINEGVVFGFVGSNGAGKSTAFSILSTLLKPTTGDAFINGKSVKKSPAAVRKQIGYMPDFFGVYDQLTVDEYLHFYAASYQLTSKERQQRIPEMLALVNLTHKRYEYVDVLSRGMKQRLCLARAMIHNPSILILDEPASGLDPRARIEMREIIRHLRSFGKTILISSHILPELAEMCDEIGVLDEGKLIAHGNVAAIQQQFAKGTRLAVRVTYGVEEAQQFFERNPLVSNMHISTKEMLLTFDFSGTKIEQTELLREAMLHDLAIISYTQENHNLEDVFMAITEGAKEHDSMV